MAENELVKRYKKDGLTILWKPAKCIHSEICVKTLPGVYRPGEKPWIQPESASVEALKAQIDRCPSAALTYELQGQKTTELNMKHTEMQIIKGGPLMVKGPVTLEGADGTIENLEGTSAFCRCGASGKKPFCDGSHRKVTFE
jgi:uncharacterized Fe-S cluster protein YjdI